MQGSFSAALLPGDECGPYTTVHFACFPLWWRLLPCGAYLFQLRSCSCLKLLSVYHCLQVAVIAFDIGPSLFPGALLSLLTATLTFLLGFSSILSPHDPRFNAVLVLASTLPILIFVGWTMPDWNPADWTKTEGNVNLSLMLGWQIWLYSGKKTSSSCFLGIGIS